MKLKQTLKEIGLILTHCPLKETVTFLSVIFFHPIISTIGNIFSPIYNKQQEYKYTCKAFPECINLFDKIN